MEKYTSEERTQALQVVSSTITKCEKSQLKFTEGTSQHALLKNRIKAMYISKALITEIGTDMYAKEELEKALAPISSVISKCEKAQSKFEEGSTQHKRFQKLIKAMILSKSLLENEIGKRD